jgi:dCMP deaminase
VHCEDAGCLLVDNHCIRTNHAEMNAITQAAKNGSSIKDSTAYVTNMPCTTCAKALIASGVKRVVVFSDYHSTHAEMFFREADVRLDRLSMPDKCINYDIDSFSSAKKFEQV